MNDKPPKKELIRQEILKLIEKDPKAKDFIVEVGSERVSVSSLLADLLMDEDRLIQFLRELARDTMPIEKDPKAKDFIVEVGSERVSVSSILADLLMDEDRLIQFLRELARDTMPFEKDPKAKDFIVEVGSERVSVSSLLADLLMDEDRLIQFLRELARDTMPFESTLTRMSGRGVEVLAGQPFYLEPIRHLGSHTVGMEHFLVAMVSGPAGKRR